MLGSPKISLTKVFIVCAVLAECQYLQSSARTDGSGDSSVPGGVRSLDILGRQRRHSVLPSNVMQAVIGVKFIADHVKQQDDENAVHLHLLNLSPSVHASAIHQSWQNKWSKNFDERPHGHLVTPRGGKWSSPIMIPI